MDSSFPAAPLQFPIPETSIPEVSIIIPARNEEASLRACLESLTTQTGVAFDILVADDASTDRTRAIAMTFAGVRVISSDPLRQNSAGNTWTGKNNAMISGAKQARAQWLLFTDADTVHLPGSLARALDEAKKEQADLLSYSPEQVVITFAERAVMPVIFAELAAHYPPHKVRDEASEIVAANGQYILVRRAAYEAVGGHTAVASRILEDVALARLFRKAGHRVYFRYAGDAVRTRMYRNWPQLREGWTKNLARLFPRPEFLAFQNLTVWFAAWSTLAIAMFGVTSRHFVWILCATFWLIAYRRIRPAHFAAVNNLLAMSFGLPMFAYLLLRSKNAHAKGQVSWKGRVYSVGATRGSIPAETQADRPIRRIGSQKLRADN